VCIGVKEPFEIEDINAECAAYPEKRDDKNESTITLRLENLTKEEYGLMMKLIKKANGEVYTKTWEPQVGDDVWYIDAYEAGVFEWEGVESDWELLRIGNCFKTKTECEFAIERLTVIHELKEFAEKYNSVIDWSDYMQQKWALVYSFTDNKVETTSLFVRKQNDIYFSSEEIAEEAITHVGADRLKKYYFEVV
jgi:hypothetical protein